MIPAAELKPGMALRIEGQICKVLEAEFKKDEVVRVDVETSRYLERVRAERKRGA